MKAKNLVKKQTRKGVNTPEAVTVKISIAQLGYLDSLIETSNLTEPQRQEIESKLNFETTEGEGQELINWMLENQRDNINGGHNYNQGDIQKKLTEISTL